MNERGEMDKRMRKIIWKTFTLFFMHSQILILHKNIKKVKMMIVYQDIYALCFQSNSVRLYYRGNRN